MESFKKHTLSLKVSVLSFLIIALSTLVITIAWSTKHVVNGGQFLPSSIAKMVVWFASAPNYVRDLISVMLPPKGVTPKYQTLSLKDQLLPSDLNGYLLIPFTDKDGKNRLKLLELGTEKSKEFDLSDFDNKPGQYSDSLNEVDSVRWSRQSSRRRISHPIFNGQSRVTFVCEHNDLVTIDLLNGIEVWRVRGAFHHSLEKDSNGDIWAISSQKRNDILEDNVMVKVSQNGKILKQISISNLLANSGFEYLLYGSSNPRFIKDPIHLNQISPITTDAGKFRKGQLLISLRNLSTILLVDPENDKVVWLRSGPWMNQHCVIPTGQSTFSVFDNHSFVDGRDFWIEAKWQTRILNYNIQTESVSEVPFDFGGLDKLQVVAQGRAIPLHSGFWMIEDSEQGTILIFDEKNLRFRWSNRYPNGNVGATLWSRYMKSDDVPALIKDLVVE